MSKKKKKQWVILESGVPSTGEFYFKPIKVDYYNIDKISIHSDVCCEYECNFFSAVLVEYPNLNPSTYYKNSLFTKTSIFDILKQIESQRFDSKMERLLKE